MKNLNVIRTLLEGALTQLEAAMELLAEGQEQGCKHARREDISTFGAPTIWVCLDCGARSDGEEAEDGEDE